MPNVKLTHKSQLDAETCFKKIEKLFESDPDLRKLDANMECDFDEDNLCGTAKGKQFNASLDIEEDGDTCLVHIVVKLPFHLALAKGVVATMLTKKLAKYVG